MRPAHGRSFCGVQYPGALSRLPTPVTRKLKYYRQYLATDAVRLEGCFARTELDGHKEAYAEMLWRGLLLDDAPGTEGGGAPTAEEEQAEAPLPPGMRRFVATLFSEGAVKAEST